MALTTPSDTSGNSSSTGTPNISVVTQCNALQRKWWMNHWPFRNPFPSLSSLCLTWFSSGWPSLSFHRRWSQDRRLPCKGESSCTFPLRPWCFPQHPMNLCMGESRNASQNMDTVLITVISLSVWLWQYLWTGCGGVQRGCGKSPARPQITHQRLYSENGRNTRSGTFTRHICTSCINMFETQSDWTSAMTDVLVHIKTSVIGDYPLYPSESHSLKKQQQTKARQTERDNCLIQIRSRRQLYKKSFISLLFFKHYIIVITMNIIIVILMF